MVKAAAETAILCGADKDKCQSVIDVAGKVQLGCEIVGMALDIFQAGRAISATRSIAKGTETAMKEAALNSLMVLLKVLPKRSLMSRKKLVSKLLNKLLTKLWPT